MFAKKLIGKFVEGFDKSTQLMFYYAEWAMFAITVFFYINVVWKLRSKVKQQTTDILLVRAFFLLVVFWFIFEFPRLLRDLAFQYDWYNFMECYYGTFMLCNEETGRLRFRYRTLIYHSTELFGRFFNFFNCIILIAVFKRFREVFQKATEGCFRKISNS